MEMNLSITLLNIVYAALGAAIGLTFMIIGYRVFDKITPFDTHEQLEKGNIAVGIVIGSIFVGLGISVGLIVGMGLN